MAVEYGASLPAPPHRVLAELTDPDFLRAWAGELGVRLETVEVGPEGGGTRTTLRLAVATRGVPPVFARFVGSEVTFVDSTVWHAEAGTRASGALEVRAQVFGRSVLVLGRRTLEPEREGTRSATVADVTVDAPIIGRRAEAAVAEMVGLVLRRESELLLRRLA